jgi:hypothetical protein
MNKKQLIEFVPLTIFLISGICTILKLPYATWVTALSGALLGMLYFYVAYWLYSESGISTVNRIICGLAYSTTTVACFFCFLNWPNWNYFGIFSCFGLMLVIIICLHNNKSAGYKAHLYRGVFFLIILSMVCGYRRFLA